MILCEINTFATHHWDNPFEAPPPLSLPPDFFESALEFAEPDEFGTEQH